ncbi:mitochondrial inner membrane protein COX18 [Carlito syrichta]|uniref:Mitochondrial inner membrane protein COX18 n=1 Tax=Carlito syrichta TaxID=1868482 RepID=A0A3Q0ED77_CARSF|nr:mitochondrial inner membrane protein COX18 [Carlito syrichta]
MSPRGATGSKDAGSARQPEAPSFPSKHRSRVPASGDRPPSLIPPPATRFALVKKNGKADAREPPSQADAATGRRKQAPPLALQCPFRLQVTPPPSRGKASPVRSAEEVLLGAHSASGLPWWGSILLTTVALRGAVTLPLAAYQHCILAKVENLQPEIKNIASHLNQEVAVRANQLGWSRKVARLTYLKNMRRLVSELYVRDNCHPFKATVLVWIQLPMWVFMSVALRNFSTGAAHSEAGRSVQEQLASGGVLWFPDLTALDSTWILPVSVGVINLLIVEIFALQKIGISRFQTYITYFVRAVSVLMIPIAATVPSSIVLYWLCSSFMGLSQNLLLRSPGFRQLCRIPLTKSDSETPYKDLLTAFNAKFISRK